MHQSLQKADKNVLITGTNRGIGLEFVIKFSKIDGIGKIFACCRNPNEAHELLALQSNFPKRILILKLDVSDDETIRETFEGVKKVLGNEPLHILINNVGIFENNFSASLESPDRQVFARHFDTNTLGPLMITTKFLPLLQKCSSSGQNAVVVSLSSLYGSQAATTIPTNGNIAYGMSKAALHNFTRVFSQKYANDGIIAVSIHSGAVKTDMAKDAALTTEEAVGRMLTTIENLTMEDTGRFLDQDGNIEPF